MANQGPIVIVEDDIDDQEIISYVLKELDIPNEIIFFNACTNALHYLKTTEQQPFLILSDVNVPAMNGFEFKKEINNDPYLRKKAIPFIFLSTSADKKAIDEAYTEMAVQGFFKKADSIEEFKGLITLITNYWKVCTHPNTVPGSEPDNLLSNLN